MHVVCQSAGQPRLRRRQRAVDFVHRPVPSLRRLPRPPRRLLVSLRPTSVCIPILLLCLARLQSGCCASLPADDYFSDSDDDDIFRDLPLDAPTPSPAANDPYDADDSLVMDVDAANEDFYDVENQNIANNLEGAASSTPPDRLPLPPDGSDQDRGSSSVVPSLDDGDDYFDRFFASLPNDVDPSILQPLHTSTPTSPPPRSPSPPDTPQELAEAQALPPGAARDEAFRRLADRVGHVGTTWPWQNPGMDESDVAPYRDGAHASVQTYISVPPFIPRRLDTVLAAGFHQHHGTVGYYPDGTFRGNDPELHSRDQDTTRLPLTYGPVPSPPWPPFMARLRSATQTPRAWTHRAPPAAQGYLHLPTLVGRHDPVLRRTWVPLPAPVQPFIPDVPDRHGVRGASAPYATGTWIPSSWPRSHPSHVWPWLPAVGPLPPPGSYALAASRPRAAQRPRYRRWSIKS